MTTTDPDNSPAASPQTVLLTGASGYVGGRLIPLLEAQPLRLRCLARSPEKLRPLVKSSTEIVRGDVLDPSSLEPALKGDDGSKKQVSTNDRTDYR